MRGDSGVVTRGRPGAIGGARGRGAWGADFARGRGARGAGLRPRAPLPTLAQTAEIQFRHCFAYKVYQLQCTARFPVLPYILYTGF